MRQGGKTDRKEGQANDIGLAGSPIPIEQRGGPNPAHVAWTPNSADLHRAQRASKPGFMMALLKRSHPNWQASSAPGVLLKKGKHCEGWRPLVALGMIPTEGHGEILDFGRVKTHEGTGAVGKVVDEISPRDP